MIKLIINKIEYELDEPSDIQMFCYPLAEALTDKYPEIDTEEFAYKLRCLAKEMNPTDDKTLYKFLMEYTKYITMATKMAVDYWLEWDCTGIFTIKIS